MSFKSSSFFRASGRSGAMTAAGVAVAVLLALPALAQSPDYFVPGQTRGGAQPPRATPRPAPAPVPPRPISPAAPQGGQQQGPGPTADQEPPIQLPMPAVPELPALAKGAAPPGGVIGVIGVPDVMRVSTAAQQVDRTIGERREKLNEDAQKEQQAWRDLQQALATQRNTMSPDQIRAKERELQERITSAQRQFRDRNRIIQEAAQVGLNQIQAALIAVIRQVAESRGMNLVLHRAQVALNVNEFDITDQVAGQMNKVLPAVTLPAEGVSAAGQTPAPVPVAPSALAVPPPGLSAPSAPAPVQPASGPQK